MANPIIQFFQQSIQNITGLGNQNQTNNQAAAAESRKAQQIERQQAESEPSTPKRGGSETSTQTSSSSSSSSSSYTPSRSQNVLQEIANNNKPTQTVTQAMRENSAEETAEIIKETATQTQEATEDYSKWRNPNVDWDTPKDTHITTPEPVSASGGVLNNPVELIGTLAGVGVAGKVAGQVATKLPTIIKETTKTAGGLVVGGGLAGAGGETPVSEKTSKFSEDMKDLANTIPEDNPLGEFGKTAAGFGLGIVGGAADTVGALTSAGKGAFDIGKDVFSGNLKEGADKFLTGLDTAGAGITDWIKGVGENPAYSLGEIVGFGGVGKGISKAAKIPEAVKTKTIQEAQADITGSLSELAGFDRQATERAFRAATDSVGVASKIEVPLTSKTGVPLKELTMFEDMDSQTLGKIEKSLSDAEVVNYGTTANVLYGLNFRKTSDFDASVPGKNAEKLLSSILEDTKAYGTKPSNPFSPDASSWQIERPSPQTGTPAHMFDLKRLEQQLDKNMVTTSTLPRTPTKASEYNEIKIPGSTGKIKVEPLEFALSRKYAATYFPRTEQVANIKPTDWIAPKTITYPTKIDLESYKTGMIKNLNHEELRTIPVTGFNFNLARGFGAAGNLQAKLRNLSFEGLGRTSKQINYAPELGDAHRMKDALDLVGITWEYKNSLIDKAVKNPVSRKHYTGKLSKNLDTMLKDEYLRAQIKTGASQKLSDLSPGFATFLKSQGILSDAQLLKVLATGNADMKTAFRSGRPDLKQFESLRPSPTSKASRKPSPSPFNATPSPTFKSPKPTIPSPSPSPSPFKPDKPVKLTGGLFTPSPSPSPYPGGTTPKPKPAAFTPKPGKGASVVFDTFPELFNGPTIRKKKDEDRLEDKFGSFRTIKMQRIDHFGIYDPLEFMGKGSMTKRETRKGKAKSELTTFKKTIYEVGGEFQTRKPRHRSKK